MTKAFRVNEAIIIHMREKVKVYPGREAGGWPEGQRGFVKEGRLWYNMGRQSPGELGRQ